MKWPTVPLRDLGQWYGGGTPSKHNAAFWDNGDVPWLSPKDMGPEVLADTQDHITRAAIEGSSTKLVPSGAVAVVVRSGILERTLPVALVPFETTLNQDMKAVVARPDVEPLWVAWALRAFERELLRHTRKAGTTVASIEMPRFFDFKLPLPPLAEQRRIVDILEEHLTSLEDARRSLDQARVRSVAFWHSTLTRHLDGPVRPLGDVTVHASYGTSTKCTPEGLGPPVARIPNLVAGKIDMTDEKRADDTALDLTPFYLRMGDLLIVRTNGSRDLIGRSAVADRDMDVAFASYLIRFQLDARQALSEWVHLALESLPLRAQIEGLAASSAGQYNLGLKKLTSLKLPLPAVEQQGERLSIIRGSRDSVRRLQASIHDQTRRAGSLRMAVLSAAFLGQLTGRSSDTQLIEDLADQEAAS